MIAVDSGFLFALADSTDAWHIRAMAAAPSQEEGWITTWAVLTEACHLYQARIGMDPAVALMEDVASGAIRLWTPPPSALGAIPALLRKYASLPMDLADASLLLLAEHLDHGRILTTDERDFGVYRWKSRKPFKNVLAAAG